MSEGGQKVQTYSYKINNSWGCNVQHGDTVNDTLVYLNVAKTGDLKSPQSQEKKNVTMYGDRC